jgi:hypothetical protein
MIRFRIPRNRYGLVEAVEILVFFMAFLTVVVFTLPAILDGEWFPSGFGLLTLAAILVATKLRGEYWTQKRKARSFVDLDTLRKMFPQSLIGADVQADSIAGVIQDPVLDGMRSRLLIPREPGDEVPLETENRYWGDITSGSRPGLGRKFSDKEIRRRVAWLREHSAIAQMILKEYLDDVEQEMDNKNPTV